MPIIVDEIVISIEVTGQDANPSTAASAPAVDQQLIVAECVERVLDILREREER